MKTKHLCIHCTCEAPAAFNPDTLAFLETSLNDLGLTNVTIGVDSYYQLCTLPTLGEPPKNWADELKKDPAAPMKDMAVEEPKPAAVKEEPQGGLIDKAMLKKALYAVKDKLGTDALLALYEKAAGGAKTLKDVKEADYAGLFSAAQEAINAAD